MMASGEIRLSIMTMRQMPVLAQSQAGDPYPAINTGSNSSLQSANSDYPASATESAQGTPSDSALDAITVVATRINTTVGNVTSTLEQWSELALITSRGWAVNQYVRTFAVRNT